MLSDMADPGSYLDVLLDAVDAKAAFAREVGSLSELLDGEVTAVVAAAVRRGSTEESVMAEAMRRMGHLSRVLLTRTTAAAVALADRIIDSQAGVVAARGRSPRIPPIRREHLEARRLARGDSIRFDAAPLPDLDEIIDLSPRQLASLAKRLGVEIDEERLVRAVVGSTRRIVGAGVPDDALAEAVVEAGKRAVRNALVQGAKEAIRDREMAKHGSSKRDMMLWVSVLDDRTCSSCEDRHGESMTLAQWERQGMPGSDVLLCDGNCRCELVPDEWFEEEGDVEVTIELETERD